MDKIEFMGKITDLLWGSRKRYNNIFDKKTMVLDTTKSLNEGWVDLINQTVDLLEEYNKG